MHESSLARSLVHAAERAARREHGRRIVAVHARVEGPRHVSLEHLRMHFNLAAADTLAQGARLELSTRAGTVGSVVLERIEIED